MRKEKYGTYIYSGEENFGLSDIAMILKKWLWLLLLVTVLCGAAGYMISTYILPEEFQSTTRIYVLNRGAVNDSSVNYSDMQAGTQLTRDYTELIKSRTVLEQVIENLNLNETYEQLAGKVSVTNPEDTRIISITVTDNSPEMAQQIAMEVEKESAKHIQKVMDIESVNVADEANLPTGKSGPDTTKWTILFAAAGLFVLSIILIIRALKDDTVKTADDVARYFQIPTLAVIPLDDRIGKDHSKVRREHKCRKS